MTKTNLQKFQDANGKWSDETFGKLVEPLPTLFHLRKEIDELIQSPFDIIEYADCFTLLLDAARKVCINTDYLLAACNIKLEVNKTRKWGKPDKNGVIEHLREGA